MKAAQNLPRRKPASVRSDQTVRVKFVSARSLVVPVTVAGAFNNRDARQVSLKQAAGGAWKHVTPRLADRNEFVNLQGSTVNASTQQGGKIERTA